MDLRILTVTAAAMLVGAGALHAQTPPVSVSLTGRAQFQLNSTSVSAEEAGDPIAASTFETRRVRLGVGVTVSDWVSGFIEPEYALGELQLRSVWMAFELDPALVLRAGQFKKPFSLINLTSSSTLPVIERGVRIRGLAQALVANEPGRLGALDDAALIGEHYTLVDVQGYAAYDMGVSVEGERGGFEWAAGVFNGNGPDARDENDGKSLAARLRYTIDAGAPLTFGAAWSRRDLAITDEEGTFTRRGDAFAVEVELGGLREGVWLLGEVTTGRNLVTRERFAGAHGVAALFFPTRGRIEGIEPAARVSWGDPDDTIDGDEAILFTPGINVYFTGRNRLMLNWDVFEPLGDGFTRQHALRAQANLYF